MEFLLEWGYLGLFIGSLVASTIVPLSSDFLLVGMLMAGGNPLLTLLVATAGNCLGGMTSYALGRTGRWDLIEKYLGVTRSKLERQQTKIEKYGIWLAIFAWLPIVGEIFSIGLGFYKVSFLKFSMLSLLGRAARFAVWIILFEKFGENFLNFLGI